MSDAFISYSHHDRDFVVRLQTALRESGKAIWLDESDIPSGARWAEDLRGAIEDADSFVFVISPASVESQECLRELGYAAELHKRIIPLNLRSSPLDDLPETIRAVQFVPPRGIFENDPDPASENTFAGSLQLLITAIDTDLDATREHTEWGKKALEWDKHTRDRSFLLSGSELEAAEQWLLRSSGRGPEPTDLQKSYVLASRQGATRRQRRLLGGVTVALGVALLLGAIAIVQRNDALRQEHLALSGELASESSGLASSNVELQGLLSLEAYAIAPTGSARSAIVQSVGQPLRAILRGDSSVNSVAVSPDHEILAAGYDSGKVVLWNTSTGTQIGRPLDAGGEVDSVAFSPNGETLAVASGLFAGKVVLWDTSSWQKVGRPISSGDGDTIFKIAFSPDGTVLALGESGGGVVLCNVALGSRISTIPVPGSFAPGIAFSPDGELLAVGNDSGSAMVWNVTTEATPTVEQTLRDGQNSVDSLAFSPDGQSLVGGDNAGNVVLWDLGTGTTIGKNLKDGDGSNVNDLAMSPDGKTIAAGDSEGNTVLLDVATGMQIGKPLNDGSPVNSVAFTPDGRTLVAGNTGGNVVLSNTSNANDNFEVLRDGNTVNAIAFSPDGKEIAAGDSAGKVTFWSTSTGTTVGVLDDRSPVTSVAFSPGGKEVAVGDASGSVPIWSTVSREILHVAQRRGSSILSVDVSPDGSTLAVGDDKGNLDLYAMATGARIGHATGNGDGSGLLNSVAFSPVAKSTLATGDSLGNVVLWNTKTGTGHRLNSGGENAVTSLAYSSDGTSLAAGDDSGNVTLWNTSAYSKVILSVNDGQYVEGVALSPDGTLLADADKYGNVVLTDTGSLAKLGQPLSGDEDGGGVGGVTFSPNGRTLAVGTSSGDVFLIPWVDWVGSSTAVTDDLCSEIRGNLTHGQWSRFVSALPYRKICSRYP